MIAYRCEACGADYPAPPPGETIRCPECGSKDREMIAAPPADVGRRMSALSEAFGMLEVVAQEHLAVLREMAKKPGATGSDAARFTTAAEVVRRAKEMADGALADRPRVAQED